MKTAKLGLFFALVMVAISPIQGWSADAQKKTDQTIQRSTQSSTQSVSQDCEKVFSGQVQGTGQSNVKCPDKGVGKTVNKGMGKGIGGPGGIPDLTGRIPGGAGGASNVPRTPESGTPQGTRVGDTKGDKAKSQGPVLKLDEMGKEVELKKLIDPKTGGLGEKRAGALTGKGPADQPVEGLGGRTLEGQTGVEAVKGALKGAVQEGGTVSRGARDAAKPSVSRREQQSEDKDIKSPNAGKKEAKTDVKTDADGNTIATRTYSDGSKDVGTTHRGGDGARVSTDKTGKTTQIVRWDSGGRWVQCGKGGPRACRPNPNDETGASTPQDVAREKAERKRQVEMGREGARVITPPTGGVEGDFTKAMVKRRTEGLIQPAEETGSTEVKATKSPFAGKGPQPGDPSEEIIGGTGATTGPSTPSKTGQ